MEERLNRYLCLIELQPHRLSLAATTGADSIARAKLLVAEGIIPR